MAQASVAAALTGRMNHLIARQGVVASNIANASTPGYIARDVIFAKEVQKQSKPMRTTNKRHMQGTKGGAASGKVVENKTFMQPNGNSVDLSTEMLKLSEIQLNHQMVTRLYAKHAALQKLAIGRGR